MKTALAMLLMLAWALGSAGQRAPRAGFVLTMKKVMSPNQFVESGVSSLSPAQRAALNKWLNDYTLRVIKIAQGSGAAGDYAGLGSGHWISDVSSGGAIVTLEDGSLWEIFSTDQVDTALWLVTTSITVLRSRNPVGDYKYLLVDTDDGEQASAKYLGSP